MFEQKLIDNGQETVVADEASTDNRHVANAKAAEIVAFVMKSETALGVTAKDWGAAIFRSVHRDNVSLDTLIGESKLAAGFATLSATEAGKKAKSRLNVYFSNARLVNERYSTLTDEQRDNVLNGVTSIHYMAAQFRDADNKAAKAAKAAETAGEAAADNGAASASDGLPESGMTLSQLADELLRRWIAASEAEQEEALDSVSLLIDTINSATVETGEVEEVEVKKAA